MLPSLLLFTRARISVIFFFFTCAAPFLTGAESLTVSFSTTSAGGHFKPANTVAVWIETSSGAFIKTIGNWSAGPTVKHNGRISLIGWIAKATVSDTDAIMGVTRVNHSGTLTTLPWSMMKKGETTTVPDGDYVVQFEMTESNTQVPTMNPRPSRASVPFTKKGTAWTIKAPDKGEFHGMQVMYTGRAIAPSFASASVNAKVAKIETRISSGEVGPGVTQLEKLVNDKDSTLASAATDSMAVVDAWSTANDASLDQLVADGDIFAAQTLAANLARAWTGHTRGKAYVDRAATLKKDPGYQAGKDFEKLATAPTTTQSTPQFVKQVDSFLKKYPSGFYADKAKALKGG